MEAAGGADQLLLGSASIAASSLLLPQWWGWGWGGVVGWQTWSGPAGLVLGPGSLMALIFNVSLQAEADTIRNVAAAASWTFKTASNIKGSIKGTLSPQIKGSS